MKKMRLFALLLAVCLLAAATPAALAVGNGGSFVVSNASGEAGDTISVTISIENNPGIIAAALRIDYDSDKLELIAVQDEELMGGTVTFSQTYSADPYYISWNDALATENTMGNGVLATLTFRIREDCAEGMSKISLTFQADDVFDKNLENQPFTAVSGTVTIGNSASEPNPDQESVDNSDSTKPAPDVQHTPATPNYRAYRDLLENGWYREYVEFMLKKGYMNGVAVDLFDPNGNVSRAQLVTILYRAAGEPAVTGGIRFSDVKSGIWYDKAVAWGSVTGVVRGVGDKRFAPNQDITREQLAVMLYRYSGSPVVGTENLSAFSDAASVSAYAKAAVNWAVVNGILTGDAGKLSPGATATRVQAAAMLTRYLKQAETVPVPELPGTIE